MKPFRASLRHSWKMLLLWGMPVGIAAVYLLVQGSAGLALASCGWLVVLLFVGSVFTPDIVIENSRLKVYWFGVLKVRELNLRDLDYMDVVGNPSGWQRRRLRVRFVFVTGACVSTSAVTWFSFRINNRRESLNELMGISRSLKYTGRPD